MWLLVTRTGDKYTQEGLLRAVEVFGRLAKANLTEFRIKQAKALDLIERRMDVLEWGWRWGSAVITFRVALIKKSDKRHFHHGEGRHEVAIHKAAAVRNLRTGEEAGLPFCKPSRLPP